MRRRLVDVEPDQIAVALADLHRSLPVGSAVTLELPAALGRGRVLDAVEGGGFEPTGAGSTAPGGDHVDQDDDVDHVDRGGTATGLVVEAVRARTLPDQVRPGLRLLICGLNPSLYAADLGVGFARPGNRFWPAALAAGVAGVDRDPRRLRDVDRVGMTDLVKRATRAADELDAAEYRRGVARLDRLVRWLRPGATCFVGLAGWRAAVDRRAVAGPLPDGFADRPAYLMPNTSGLNARSRLDDLAAHLRAALALGDRELGADGGLAHDGGLAPDGADGDEPGPGRGVSGPDGPGRAPPAGR